MQKILVAAPTYLGKEYAMSRWLDSIKHFDYPNYNILVVDTGDTLDFYERWRNQVPLVHLGLGNETPDRRVALGMEYIRQTFLAGDWTYWLNVESDIIAPSHAINLMLQYANNVDLLAAPYKHRQDNRWIELCFGFTLFSRRMAEISFADAPMHEHTDTWYINKTKGYRVTGLKRGLLKLEHLDV